MRLAGSRLRDFIHALNISEWDTAIDETEQVTIGSSIQYRGRLPKIDRRIPDDLRPHRSQNVRTWITNVPTVDGGWRSMIRDFDAAVKRYAATRWCGYRLLEATPIRSKGEGI